MEINVHSQDRGEEYAARRWAIMSISSEYQETTSLSQEAFSACGSKEVGRTAEAPVNHLQKNTKQARRLRNSIFMDIVEKEDYLARTKLNITLSHQSRT